MNTIEQAKQLFNNTLEVTPNNSRGGVSQWDHENLIIQSDEPAVVKSLALNASIYYIDGIHTLEELQHDAFWESQLEGWEQETKFDTDYIADLDNKVTSW